MFTLEKIIFTSKSLISTKIWQSFGNYGKLEALKLGRPGVYVDACVGNVCVRFIVYYMGLLMHFSYSIQLYFTIHLGDFGTI